MNQITLPVSEIRLITRPMMNCPCIYRTRVRYAAPGRWWWHCHHHRVFGCQPDWATAWRQASAHADCFEQPVTADSAPVLIVDGIPVHIRIPRELTA